MLSNKYLDVHLQQYKKIYLDNFDEETSTSFDFFVNEYIYRENIYLSIDNNNQIELGLMIIPKQLVLNQKIKSVGLIYGVVASEQYKHTKVLKRLFPNFINEIQTKFDFILIETKHWKIYQDYDLISINEHLKFKINNKNELFENNLIQLNQLTLNILFNIYQNQIKNFQIDTYINYQPNDLYKCLKVNELMGDKIFKVNDAFGLYSPIDNSLSSIYFENSRDLLNLIKSLPNECEIDIDKRFKNLLPNNLIKNESYSKTKMFNQNLLIKSLFFNEVN